MMDTSKKNELLAMAASLALLGEQVETAKTAIRALVELGFSLSSPEVLAANDRCTTLCTRFMKLEAEYKALKEELLTP